MRIEKYSKNRIISSLAMEIQDQFSLKDVLTICNTPVDLFEEFAKTGQTRIISEGLRDSYSGLQGETVVGDSFEILDDLTTPVAILTEKTAPKLHRE